MKFGGSLISSIDFPEKISLVIFFAGCPLRCPYCHNPELLKNGKDIDVESIKRKISSSKDFIDAVVLSGGEPLFQEKEVEEILKHAYSLGLKTKLDTNGIYPKKLNSIIKYLDYVSLDVKAPFTKYKEIIGKNVGSEVKESMKILNKSKVYLECRTTYVPKLMTKNDIVKIAKEIDCDLYTLQQFRNETVLDPYLKNIEPPKVEELKKIAKTVKNIVKKVKIKTIEGEYTI